MKEFNKTNPFKTPKGYFEEFEVRLSDRLKEEGHGMPENDGFGIPEGYFDGLNEKIRKELDATTTKVIPLKSYKKYVYAAASVAAIVLLFLGLNWNSTKKIGFEDLAGAEIETYFEDHEVGLSTYEIAEVIPVDELEISDMMTTQFNEENMLEYLNENLDDLEELYLEDDEQP